MTSALFALSLFAQGNVAQANWKDVEWCAEDPVVVVFGAQFKVVTAVHAPASAVSSFAYTIVVPSNAAGRTNIAYPNGKFASTTVQVSYTGPAWSGSGSFPVSGMVTVTASTNSDLTVNISGPTVPTSSTPGTANSSVSFSTNVTPNGAAGVSGSDAQ
jgi:hypothetical protein